VRESQVIVDVINQQLRDLYGSDIVTGQSIFRVSWSEDEFEYRYGTYTDFVPGTNIFLRTATEIRYVPKYRQWIHSKHLLERLVLVPELNAHELPGSKTSYEPLWVFEDKKGDYLPPRLDACKFIIDSVLSAQSIHKALITGNEKVDRPLKRYTDPQEGKSTEELAEMHRKKIDGIVNELFGDETGLLGMTLSRNQGGGETIIVPNNYTPNNGDKS
jgi:hypothetical protein